MATLNTYPGNNIVACIEQRLEPDICDSCFESVLRKTYDRFRFQFQFLKLLKKDSGSLTCIVFNNVIHR